MSIVISEYVKRGLIRTQRCLEEKPDTIDAIRHAKSVVCLWRIVRLHLFDSLHFVCEQVRPFVLNFLLRRTWNLQFAGRLTNGYSRASLDSMADLFHLLIGQTDIRIFSVCYKHTPWLKSYHIKPWCCSYLAYYLRNHNHAYSFGFPNGT
jgi:hypothetical protein